MVSRCPIGQLCKAELPHPHHLYWPDLDVDVAVESIDHPERFPLVSTALPNKRTQPAPHVDDGRSARPPLALALGIKWAS